MKTFEDISVKFKQTIDAVLLKRDKVVIALTGGRSTESLCSELLVLEIDWSRVHVFLADERLVPLSHEDSNFRLVKESLADKLIGKLPTENLHPFVFVEGDEHAALKKYNDKLELLGGTFDIVVVSAGEDGHIASLFPNHPSVKDDSVGYILVEDSPKPPANRISLSKNAILNAKNAFLIFKGTAKQTAYARFNDLSLSVEDCPAKLIQIGTNNHILKSF